MVPDVRSSASGVGFNLLTPDGVMQALAAVRTSELAPEAKRELRDIIFSYTSSGGDAALRTLIESQLAALTQAKTTVTPAEAVVVSQVVAPEVVVDTVSSATVTSSRPVVGFRGGRPAPQFRPVLVTAATTPLQTEAVAAQVAPSIDIASSIPHVAVAQPMPTPDPVPVPLVPKAVVDEKLATLATPSEPTVEYRPPYQESASADAARDRINAIKHMINTKVGNPVNLVDMNNEVGRAYMSALLEAMKAVSGGGGDVATTMQRLESVVVDVEHLFVAQSNQAVAPVPEVSVAPIAPIVPVVPVPAPVASPVAIPHKAEVIPSSTMIPAEESADPQTGYGRVPVVSADTTVVTPMAIASSRYKNVLPVTAQEPLKTPADLPTAAEVKARSGITDPLEDPDVDLGLEQLLGEWSLFKKSGMFGTGPRGRQHPLFLKLASIPMPLILSGRFEGSTNEIRQSITDYMNGWRYEQGIIYEQNETFEHYLRRVIRHIIDSQTRRRGA